MFEVDGLLRCCVGCGLSQGSKTGLCLPCGHSLTGTLCSHMKWHPFGFPFFSLFTVNAANAQVAANLQVAMKTGQRPLWQDFANRILQRRVAGGGLLNPKSVLLVPAPSSSGRLHTQLFVQALHRQSRFSYRDLLMGSKKQASQKGKGRQERLGVSLKVKEDFGPEILKQYQHVIVVDDIITTGATARAAYTALQRPKGFELWTVFHHPLLLHPQRSAITRRV